MSGKKRYDPGVEPLHISEGDLGKDLMAILKRVETGTGAPQNLRVFALMPADSTATIDPDFSRDVITVLELAHGFRRADTTCHETTVALASAWGRRSFFVACPPGPGARETS